LTATTGGGGSATGNYLDISEVRPINMQVATRCEVLGERTGLGIGENGDPANTLQEQHSHAIFAAIAYDEAQITSPTNGNNPKINDPCHTLSATNAGRALVIQTQPDSAVAVYPIRDPQLNQKANGFIVANEGEPAPTLSTTERHAIAACFAPSGFGDYSEGVGTLRASAGKHGTSSANIVFETSAINSSGKGVAGTLDSNYYRGTGARSGVEREFVGVIEPIRELQAADDLNEIVTMFENNSRGGYKEGCGTLRASGGDYGGSSENLIVILKKIAYWIRYELRKLTPLECERLQGFPDYWTKYDESGAELPDTPRYRALGNSLTVPCAERVFRGIIAVTRDNGIK